MPHRTIDRPDPLAVGLRGFGPLGIIAILLILFAGNIITAHMVAIPAGAVLVLAWVRLSHTPWREIGYVRPRNWIAAAVIGLFAGSAFKLVMKMIVTPLVSADPVNHTYHFLAGNRALLPAAVWTMLAAGFGEETVFRGFLFERWGKLFGYGAPAKISIVLLSSVVFGAAHYSTQGFNGSWQAAIVGLAFGSVFAFTGSIFPLMCAHAAFDLTALAMIYWDLEAKVAHLIFRRLAI